MEIPEYVLFEDVEFIQIEDEITAELARNGRLDDFLDYEIGGIYVDCRLAELFEFANEYGYSLQQVVDLRLKQLDKASRKQDVSEELKEYQRFLRAVKE